MEKQEARRRVFSRLSIIADKTERSQQIVNRLFSLAEIRSARSVAAYFNLHNEVCLDNFICELIRQNKPISVPVATDNALKFVELSKATELKKGRFGIREPLYGNVVENFDVIVVPMVAFDENKNRLGHGKGYYDRALKNGGAVKIGVAFEAQREEFECDAHDVKMDIIVTEDRVIR